MQDRIYFYGLVLLLFSTIGCTATPQQLAEAELVLSEAKIEATRIRSEAEKEALASRNAAQAEADSLVSRAQDQAGIVRSKGQRDAEDFRRSASEESDQVRNTAKAESTRIVDEARMTAIEKANSEAARILAEAKVGAASVKSQAEADAVALRRDTSESVSTIITAVVNTVRRVVPEASRKETEETIKEETRKVESAFRELLPSLEQKLIELRSQIQGAETESAKLAGGLVKSLIEARIHVQKLTESLLEQRIDVLKTGAHFSIVADVSKPDPDREHALEQEILAAKAQVADAQKESARYSGGLVKAMVEAKGATAGVTLAMLEQSYLHAKYGLSVPPIRSTSGSADTIGKELERVTKTVISEGPIKIEMVNKDFQESNLLGGIAEDQVTFSFLFTSALEKDVRAFTGEVVFLDLFDREIVRVNLTNNEGVRAGGSATWRGGIGYNMFKAEHHTLRSTEKKDLKVRFLLEKVIFPDGNSQAFGE